MQKHDVMQPKERISPREAPLKSPPISPPLSPPPFQLSIDEPVPIKQRTKLSQKVLIINTGGTIGMKKRPDGALEVARGALSAELHELSELSTSESIPRCFLSELDPLLDSSNMGPTDWGFLARAIEQEYFSYDGFVVIHGTDTMAYTASALSFMLVNLGKPVILTGSMYPIFHTYSDARRNLVGAILVAGFAECLNEVCIFFHDRLMRGNRTTKVDATSLHAFDSLNFPVLGVMAGELSLRHDLLMPPPRGRFKAFLNLQSKILSVHLVPGFDDSFFQMLATSDSKVLKGLVLLLYGCGNAPDRRVSMLQLIRQIVDRGILVVACSQCGKGTVSLEHYAVGKALEDVGVVGASDMTVEATCAKMAYLLARELSPKDVRQAMKKSLRGEMTQIENTRFGNHYSGSVAGQKSQL